MIKPLFTKATIRRRDMSDNEADRKYKEEIR
jgi:hypothetical protein